MNHTKPAGSTGNSHGVSLMAGVAQYRSAVPVLRVLFSVNRPHGLQANIKTVVAYCSTYCDLWHRRRRCRWQGGSLCSWGIALHFLRSAGCPRIVLSCLFHGWGVEREGPAKGRTLLLLVDSVLYGGGTWVILACCQKLHGLMFFNISFVVGRISCIHEECLKTGSTKQKDR